MTTRYLTPSALSAALALVLAGCDPTAAPQHDADWYSRADPQVTQAEIDHCDTLPLAQQPPDCGYAYQGQAQRESFGPAPTQARVERHEITRT